MSFCEILGENLDGKGPGPMVRKSGRRNGLIFYLSWGIHSVVGVNSLWNVSNLAVENSRASNVDPHFYVFFFFADSDFLNVWQEIQRTIIFDDTWVMSSQWLLVSQPFPSMASWSYGDISCQFFSQFTNFFLKKIMLLILLFWTVTFSLPVASPAIIVLSKYDVRYFKDIQGPCIWHLDFILAREGETEPLAESSYSFFYTRSVNVELYLEAGNYIVLVSQTRFLCNFFFFLTDYV